jgi:CRP-like cAMP-binding protein
MEINGHRENWLLAQLAPSAFEILAERMERISIRLGDVIVEQGGPLRHAWFPNSAVFSLLTVMTNGASAETCTVGKEGMLGVQLLAGIGVHPQRIVTQVAGETWRIPADRLAAVLREQIALRELLTRYSIAFLQQANQNAACNRLHNVQQRMARWLLFTRDRVGRDEFEITQNFLAEMLGVHRPTVSNTAAALQEAGMIAYRRGRLSLLDRAALRDTSCECYGVTKTVYDQLIRRPPGLSASVQI